jgi:hypothetical protein
MDRHSNLAQQLWQTPGSRWPRGTMKQPQTLSALFAFSGFRVRNRLQGIFGDPHAWLVVLVRRKNGRVLRRWDAALCLLRPHDTPVAGYGCGGSAHPPGL